MTSKTTSRFWECFGQLPADIQRQAGEKYKLWRRDPFHASLQFKELTSDLWSIRISLSYRALARRRGELVTWFWIGTHAEYDRLISDIVAHRLEFMLNRCVCKLVHLAIATLVIVIGARVQAAPATGPTTRSAALEAEATMVTLDARGGVPPLDVLAEFERVANVRFDMSDFTNYSLRARKGSRPVNVKLDNVPLYEALRDVLPRMGLRLQPLDGNELAVDAMPPHHEWLGRDHLRIDYGAMIVGLHKLESVWRRAHNERDRPDAAPWLHDRYALLQVFVEPKLDVWLIDQIVEMDEASDREGRSLLSKSIYPNMAYPTDRDGPMTLLHVPLLVSEKVSPDRLATFRGRIGMTRVLRRQRVEFDLTAEGRSVRRAGPIEVKVTPRDAGSPYAVFVELSGLPGEYAYPLQPESCIAAMAALYDSQGARLARAYGQGDILFKGGAGSAHLRCSSGNRERELPPPAKLVMDVPVEFEHFEVPFEFRDVPFERRNEIVAERPQPQQ